MNYYFQLNMSKSWSDNALEGVPGAAGADKELDETQLCSSKYEIRSHGEILLIFFTLLPVKFIAA